MKNDVVTHGRLRELLNYDYATGELTWRIRKARCIHVGDVAGNVSKRTGYRGVMVDGKYYLAHRLSWFYITGEWPRNQIDHINRNRADNRITNLREATSSQNQMNTVSRRVGTASGIKGVVWSKRCRKWKAQIGGQGKTTYLGYFDTTEQANIAYTEAAKKLFKEFYNEA
jgi:hypothetical protein